MTTGGGARFAGLNWSRSGHTWSAERPDEDGRVRYYTIEDFPGYGQSHLLVSVDEHRVNHLEHYDGQFRTADEARAAADHLDGMHFVDLSGYGDYEAMDDDQLNHYQAELLRQAAAGAPPKVIRRDDIRLIQPTESGLEYPVVGQWNEEHGSWDVLKQLDPPRKRGRE